MVILERYNSKPPKLWRTMKPTSYLESSRRLELDTEKWQETGVLLFKILRKANEPITLDL
jgi:hypothetical protein